MSDSNTFSITISGMPTWYPASAGVVVDISAAVSDSSTMGSTLAAVGGTAYPNETQASLVAYSGGALAYVGGQPYLYIYGGGHSDGSWNGILRYGPLYGPGSDTPTWSLAAAASTIGNIPGLTSGSSVCGDGRPVVAHTYNELCCVGADLYGARITFGWGSPATGNNSGYHYSPSTGWNWIGVNPNTSGQGAFAHHNGKLYYAPGGGIVYADISVYDISAGSWSLGGSAGIVMQSSVSGAIDSARSAFFAFGNPPAGSAVASAYWNLSTLARRTGLTRAPTSTFTNVYDKDLDAFVSWGGGLTVYQAPAATIAAGGDAVWSARNFSGATPAAQAGTGTFGRFQYIAELKGYLVVPNYNSHVYFMRAS